MLERRLDVGADHSQWKLQKKMLTSNFFSVFFLHSMSAENIEFASRMSVKTDDLFASRSDGGKAIIHAEKKKRKTGRRLPQTRFQANSIKPPAGFYLHRRQPTETGVVNYR